MGMMDEINVAVKEQSEKRANFFTEKLLVPALTWSHRMANERYKRDLEAQRQKRLQQEKASTIPPRPNPPSSAYPASTKSDPVAELAKGVKNGYRGPLGSPQYYSGGRNVVR